MRSAARFTSLLFSLLLLSCGSDVPESEKSVSTDSNATGSSPESSIKDSAHYETLLKNPAPLTDGKISIDAVVTEALKDLEKSDTASLKALLITRDEYIDILYPELGRHWPGARDMRPEIKTILWENHAGNTMKGLRRALRDLGGQKLKLQKIEFADGSKEYVSYTIHEGTVVTVKNEEGKEQKLGQIGSIVEKDGIFKLLSYRDREVD